ncbi:purine permease [Didymella exigua CBS 183.55]|uniref:Purine permease n=1 Tax=Didymella exigua CBS 183.55 TaxID=1150837 RepID=A0A6A5RDG6_9PLEO|nr:purine permease [Didymella exigua CBS 183.55]KAF1925360.1 purine permease [Didymella exigua CBS 183.55]
MDNKSPEDTNSRSISQVEGVVLTQWKNTFAELRYMLTTKDGWIGDYDYLYLVTPNIWPLNRRYKDYKTPFYGLHDRVPLLLTLLLGLQHALCMIGSIVSPPLAIASGAFHFESEMTEYLVSTAFIITGLATALQVTRLHITKTPFFIGTGLLSVVGPTFDILPIVFNYAALRYKSGTCPVGEDGTEVACPQAWGAVLGTMLCCVWIQVAMAFVPPKILNKVFPKLITGSLLTLIGVYLVGNGLQNWGGSSNCHSGEGFYALCPDISAPKPLAWGHPKLIGLGFSVFATIVLVEAVGAPLMRSAAVIVGLAVGCAISGALGYWSTDQLAAAPSGTFLWVHTFDLSVDGTLVLPLIIMFACQAISCIPDLLATAELSAVDIEGADFSSRIQGGILCDGLGSFFSALATGPPMVSQAGNNGVIVLTGCASRRAGWAASGFLILMGVIAKFGAIFASMPPSVLGGMQVFLYSTIAVAGVRVLALVNWSRRDRFILTVALGIGFMDICQPDWFSSILTYDGPNQSLVGLEQGINLAVETPFVISAIVGVFLNSVLPRDKASGPTGGYGDDVRHPVIGVRQN